MPEESNSCIETSEKSMKIISYGFDAAGFKIPNKPVNLKKIGTIKFIQFDDEINLDNADGVIIPQGIFEKIQYVRSPLHNYHEVNIAKPMLLDRERQILNLLKNGKWICFLVGEIIDKVSQGIYIKDIKDTDLCKKILNYMNVKRQRTDGISLLDSKDNEFISFIKEYGVAKTIFDNLPHTSHFDSRVLAVSGNDIVGFETNGQIFLLPFHTTKFDSPTLNSIVIELSRSIIDYRNKRIIEIPNWVDEFQFEQEIKFNNELNLLREKENTIQNMMYMLRQYKSILTTSGTFLKKQIIKVLEVFFELKVDPLDDNREDAKIIDDKGDILAVIEVKGTKKGIKREYINQVDSHRERNELTSSTPGILIINNEMAISGIDKRLNTKVPDDQLKHAKINNILIIRTIDLLFLMQNLEYHKNRKDILMNIISAGGGWLKADSINYKVVSSSD